MSLFSFGKRLLNRFPFLLKHVSTIYNIIGMNRYYAYGKRNTIYKGTSFLKNCRIIIKGNNNRITFGNKCLLNKTTINIVGDNNTIQIGNEVCIYEGEFHIEDNGNLIDIGEKTLICGKTHLAAIEGTVIKIGKESLFSSDIVFRTGDSHSILNFEGERINHSQDILLGDRVWIGNRVICTKGASMANDSIIGTGSILTKPINRANVVVAGIPAKVIKENIKWCRERI